MSGGEELRMLPDRAGISIFCGPTANPPSNVDFLSNCAERERRIQSIPLLKKKFNNHNNHNATKLTLTIGHAFRKNAAGAFGPDLARKLSQLVKMEKNVMRSMELVARERMDVAVCITISLGFDR